MPKITLEQWLVFKTIVDEGSFAAAAERLNKSQSGVSYAMQQMANQLPTPVLTLQGRKATLTPAGEVLYRHAEHLIQQAQAIEALAHDMAQGIEGSIAIAADALTPQPALFAGLQAFSAQCPRTRVKVFETSLSGTDEALLTGQVHLAITPRVPPGFLGDVITTVHMLAVAASQHPLAIQAQQTNQPLTDADLKRERQIVLRDSGLKREQNAGWLGAEQRWTFSHFATSVNAVKAGLGFAFLPRHFITHELANGSLVALPLQTGSQRQIPLHLVLAAQNFAGPASQAAHKALLQAFKFNP